MKRISSPHLSIKVASKNGGFKTAGFQGKFHDYRGFLLLVIGGLALWMTISFLKPVIMGAIFATVLYPLMLRLAKWRVSAAIKAGLVTLGFTVAFLIPLGVLVGVGTHSALERLQELQTHFSQNSDGGSGWSVQNLAQALGLEGVVAQIGGILPFEEAQIRQGVTTSLQKIGGLAASLLQRLIADLPGFLLSTIVILFAIFFFLIDGRRAVQFIRENSFFSPSATDRLLVTLNSLCYSTVVASIVAGVVQTTLLVLVCLLTGTPNVLLIGLVTFIFSFFPMVGTAPVSLFLTAEAFFTGDITRGVVFIVAMFVIGMSDNVVRPYVLRGGANLHPLVGFVAAFGGLEAIGFYGLFIGPVIAGLFFHLLPLIAKSYSPTSSRVR